MPGVGGGSRGGGGFGGGSRGGGFSGGGGGFGGGGFHHHHYHSPFHYRRPFFFFGGPGFFGGGILRLVIFIILAFALSGTTVLATANKLVGSLTGDYINYDEQTFREYADAQYQKAFSESENYEENILIVFLTTKGGEEYYFIGYVGNDLPYNVRMLFGGNGTALGDAFFLNVPNSGYWDSLTMSMSDVVYKMNDEVLKTPGFELTPTNGKSISLFNNYTEYDINADTVQKSLNTFKESTGYNISLVVEDAFDVFPVDYSQFVFPAILVIGVIAFVIFIIVRNVKNRPPKNGPSGSPFGNDRPSGGPSDNSSGNSSGSSSGNSGNSSSDSSHKPRFGSSRDYDRSRYNRDYKK